jgi:hypothetical protein
MGSLVLVAASHKIYESIQASNVGHAPSASPTFWLDRGYDNRYRMFDTSVASKTINPTMITTSLYIADRIDSLAILNVYAKEITVTISLGVDVLYTVTESMVNSGIISDWYAWFFEPILFKQDLILTDLPNYSGVTVDISLVPIFGKSVECGAVIGGTSRLLGLTQYGVNLGIQDYSVKSRDSWGDYTIVERSYNKRATFSLEIENNSLDAIFLLLSGFRATPILYIGTDMFSSTMIFGFYKDFSIDIAYLTHSTCSLEIEGLV